MMRIAAANALALAASTNAQTVGQSVGLTVEVDDPVLEPGQSTTVRLVARFDPADYALAGVATSLLFDGLAGEPRDSWSDLRLLPPFDGPELPPTLEADRIRLIIAGQLNFPPAGIYADPINPAPFFEATFTAPLDAGWGYRVDLLTETSRFDVYIDRESSRSESRMDILVEGSAAIHVIPAPASATALMLGLACTRRRR
jgi:hypothetical protein